jgi:hypothetical protein
MGMFDQAGRLAVKLDATGFFRWLFARFARPDPSLTFRGWLDTRRVPFPGDPDRTNDAVADFDNRDEPGGRFALIVEVQTEPDPVIVERLALYALQLRLELGTPAGGKGRYPVGMAVLNLTGAPEPAVLDLPIPGASGCGLVVRPIQRNLGEQDAHATLAEIAAGQTSRCVLPWVPLMRSDDLPAIITEWKRLAESEPDTALRSAYAGLAVVFAELTKGLVQWQKGLEGWNVRESQIILGWKREGKEEGALETKRADLIHALEFRLRVTIPPELRNAIDGTNDLDILSRWFDAALGAQTLDEFRAALT